MIGLKKGKIKNPTTGLYSRNPTHVEESEYARTQADIVAAVTQSGRKIKQLTLENYLDEDEKMNEAGKGNPLSGIRRIRSMEEEECKDFFATVMKFRKDILTLQVSLGNYDINKTKQVTGNNKINALNTMNGGLWPTQLGHRIGELMSDRRLNIVWMQYDITFGPSGTMFQLEFHGADDDSYEDEALFDPKIYVKYQTTR